MKNIDKSSYSTSAGLSLLTVLLLSTIFLFTLFIPITEATNATIVYRSNTGSCATDLLNCPKIRTWDSAGSGTWSAETELTTAGSPVRNAIIRYSNISTKRIIVTLSDDGNLDAYVSEDGSSWTVSNDIGSVWTTTPTIHQKRFSVSFETSSGDALVVYSTENTSASCDLAYKVLPVGSITFSGIAEQCIDDSGHATDIQYTWVETAADPVTSSDEIVLVSFDETNSDVNAFVWDGDAWGNQQEITASSTETAGEKAIAVAYASDGSKTMVISGDGLTGNAATFFWNGFSWTDSADFDVSPGGGGAGNADMRWIHLESDPSTDDIQAIFEDVTSDLGTAYWNGSTWSVTADIDTGLDKADTRLADFAWNPSGSTGKLIWDTDGGSSTLSQMTCSPECTGTASTISTYAAQGEWTTLFTNPTDSDTVNILGIRLNTVSDIGSFTWDGTSFANYGDAQITTDATTGTYESYNLAFQRSFVPGVIPTASVSSSANRVFTVGDSSTTISTITITDDASIATITTGNDIRITIPSGFNMIWDTSDITATVGGTASTKVSTTVSYEDSDRTLVVNVTTNFASSDTLTIGGLSFTSFSAASSSDNLELETDNIGTVVDTDDKTIAIGAPTISSAGNQQFVIDASSTAISAITITDDSSNAVITSTGDIRVTIPSGFNMQWDASDTTATIGGTASAKASTTVTFEDSNRTMVVDVTSDLAAGETIIISDLSFTTFSATSSADNLELEVSNQGTVTDTDDKTITIVSATDPSISSAANQLFTVNDPSTTISTITVTESSNFPVITAANDLRITIPSGFSMQWDASDTTATIGGTASAKASTTVSYEDSNRTLVIAISSDLTASETLIISDLSFTSFSAASSADNLELEVDNAGTVVTTDDKTIAIGAPTISSAGNQQFIVGDPATAISTITITEDSTTATITAVTDVRITIPSGFNMQWDTSDTTATIGGTASAKASTTVSYEDSNRTLVIDVTSDMAAGETLIISGLSFAIFSAVSTADNLELEVNNLGTVTDTDDKTITIIDAAAPTISSAANQLFVNGDASTVISTITITESSNSPVITSANDLRITIPSGFNMQWDTSDSNAVIGGTASSKAAANVDFEDSNRTLVISISGDLTVGQTITISSLSFTSFSAASSPDNLEMEVDNAGTVVSTDDRTIAIGAPTISSAANQVFSVNDPTTAISAITITEDSSTAVATSVNDIRITIPSTFNMVWDVDDTTATIGGTASAKASTTVSYIDSGRTLVVNLISDLSTGETIIISDLSFINFTAASSADSLELGVGSGATVANTDDKTIAIGAPTISSAANQQFAVGNSVTAISTITITDSSTSATITAANDIRITIPSGFNMQWDASDITATIGGTASAKASTTVSYEDSNRTLVIDVTSNLTAGETIIVSDLSFISFTGSSDSDNLELEVNNLGTVTDTDDKTITIIGTTISSAANRIFTVGDSPTAISTILIIDDQFNPMITAASDLRITIPSGFNMQWDASDTTILLGGNATPKAASSVTYEDSNRTMVVSISSNFDPGDSLTISGLSFASFTSTSAADNLELEVDNAGTIAATDDKTITIVAPTISSAANQTFSVGQAITAISTITITESATSASINTGGDIRITIPSGFNMQWDTSDTTAILAGTASTKASTTVSYEDSNRTLVIDVTSNFSTSETLIISGLSFTSFTAGSTSDNLELEVKNNGGVAATDDKFILVSGSTISSAVNQVFVVGNSATAISAVTVTEDSGSATITALNDIRITIPSGFNMVWDTSDTTAIIGGTASAKASTTVSYEDSDKTLVINVTSDFATSETLIISGLSFTNINATSSADNLDLETDSAGTIAAEDDKTIAIIAPTISSATTQTFSIGDAATPISTITIMDSATSATITAVNDIRIRIPTGFNMTWDLTDTTANIGGPDSSKVSNTVSYEDSNQTLVIDVTSDFGVGDSITVAGLSFTYFIGNNSVDNLELEVKNNGGIAALDDKLISIGQVVNVTTDQTDYEACGLVYYTLSVFDASEAATNADFNLTIANTTGSLLKSETGTTSAGIYQSNFTLATGDDEGIWTIEAFADNVQGLKTFFVGLGTNTTWIIESTFDPDSIVYANSTSISMNFTPLNLLGQKITGLLPADISVFIDTTNQTSSVTETNGVYQLTYVTVTGSHLVNVTVDNIVYTRAFIVS